MIFTGGCGTLNLPALASTPTLTNTAGGPAAETATPAVTLRLIRVWLPSRFDPASTVAGDLIRQRIDAFEAAHPGLHVDVRVKDEATLLNTLAVTRAAAPAALPDLVALPRPELEAAALKGLLHAFDEQAGPGGTPDWYPYARDAARVQDITYGLPFAGDALAVVYRPSKPVDATSWASLRKDGFLGIPPGDPRALLALGLYQSLGGQIEDAQGRPMLDEAVLAQTLDFYSIAPGGAGRSPIQFASDEGLWEAFQDRRIGVAITWASHYLNVPAGDALAAPVPGLAGAPYTLGTVWCWALAGSDSDRGSGAIELANFLDDPVFLAGLSDKAGYLPTRRAALEAWPDHDRQFFAAQMVNSAHLVPSQEIIRSLGPVLTAAVAGVLSGESPQQAGQVAVQQLK